MLQKRRLVFQPLVEVMLVLYFSTLKLINQYSKIHPAMTLFPAGSCESFTIRLKGYDSFYMSHFLHLLDLVFVFAIIRSNSLRPF